MMKLIFDEMNYNTQHEADKAVELTNQLIDELIRIEDFFTATLIANDSKHFASHNESMSMLSKVSDARIEYDRTH